MFIKRLSLSHIISSIIDILLGSVLLKMAFHFETKINNYPFTSNPFSCKLFNLGIGGTFPTHALMRVPPTETVHDPQSPL
jgi:hypothetical protein